MATPRFRLPQLSARDSRIEALKPPNKDYGHQDSLFGNSFQSKAYFVVHPEWLSENVNPPISKPMNRPPWPWEQPRYRVNVQTPRTYDPPATSGPRRTPYHLTQMGQAYAMHDPLTTRALGTPFRRPDFYQLRY